MSELFIRVYEYFKSRRWLFGLLLAVFMGIAVWLGLRLQFEEDISKIMPLDPEVGEMNKLIENSEFSDRLVVLVTFKDSTYQPENPDELIAYCDALVDTLQKTLDSTELRRIVYRIDESRFQEVYDVLYENLPLFLEEDDYGQIEKQLQPGEIPAQIEGAYRSLMTPGGSFLKKYVLRDPLSITRLGLDRLQSFQLDENYTLVDGYIVTKDYRNLLFFITPAQSSKETLINKRMLRKIDALTAAASNAAGQRIETIYFGAMAVAVDNATQIRRDVTGTLSVAFLFLFLLIGYFFRRPLIFFYIILPIIFGAATALAVLYLVKGEVSIISVGIGSMLLGITVDYSLHVFTHYRSSGNVQHMIRDLVLPLLLCSLTTAGAFLCLYSVRSEALHDLGLFAALCVLGTAFFALLILPVVVSKSVAETGAQLQRKTFLDAIATYPWDRNRVLMWLILVASVFFAFQTGKVEFERDLNKVNFMSEKVIAAENRLNRITSATMRGVYLVTSGSNLDEALERNAAIAQIADSLKKEGFVKEYTSASRLLLTREAQQAKIDRWNQFWTADRKQLVKSGVDKTASALQFRDDAFREFYTLLDRKFEPQDPGTAFAPLVDLFLSDYISNREGFVTILTLLRLDQGAKSAVYATYHDRPHVNILDKEYMIGKFVDILGQDFNKLVVISLLLVFVILHLGLGRIELAIIAFTPLALSWFWTMGLMHVFDLKFNIINIIITTFVFGVGIDYSIFVIRGLLQDYKYGVQHSGAFKTSVFISALTTLVGIGVLIFAKHPALKSVAALSIIGVSSSLLLAFTIEPWLFRWLFFDKNSRRRDYPRTLANILKTLSVYLLLIIGSVIVTIIGTILFPLFFLGRERRKYILHWVICQLSRFYIWFSFFPNRRVVNETGEDFSRPAIVISNHQSHIDTPIMFGLSPKLIILTKGWVYNFPLYYFVVRLADFFTVAKGLDVILPQLRERVANGYHVAIFPEGSRSETEEVQRFHKGAFYLAEQLQMDILPIYLHGTGRFLRRERFWGETNDLTVRIGERISYDDPRFGEDYTTRAKKINAFYREQYAVFQRSCKTPYYYRRQLIENYIYKGPLLEWYTRIKTRMEGYYDIFDKIIPAQARITDIGCGYGYLAYMLSFLSDQRTITGIDYDEDKISVANNCADKNDRLRFVQADVAAHPLEESDVFVLADVLHYLLPEEQWALLNRCLAHLAPGGMLLVRDGDRDLAERHKGTWLTEVFSTNIGFNKTRNPLHYISGSELENWARQNGLSIERIDQTKRTSNVIFVLRSSSGGDGIELTQVVTSGNHQSG
jgi:1-acyl-sn-glycerol-3-phosphate acyltransferase